MVQLPSGPSDSGNSRSTSEARCWAICRITPASQVMVLEAVSRSLILSIRRIETTTSPWCGVWPPTRPVLPPCGTSAILCSVASLQMAATCEGERAAYVEGAKISEKIGGGLVKIALRGQIHHRGRRVNSRHRIRAKRQQRFAGLDLRGIEPHPGSRRVMRGQHARRQWLAAGVIRILLRLRQRPAEHTLDLAARQTAGAQQHRLIEASDNG